MYQRSKPKPWQEVFSFLFSLPRAAVEPRLMLLLLRERVVSLCFARVLSFLLCSICIYLSSVGFVSARLYRNKKKTSASIDSQRNSSFTSAVQGANELTVQAWGISFISFILQNLKWQDTAIFLVVEVEHEFFPIPVPSQTDTKSRHSLISRMKVEITTWTYQNLVKFLTLFLAIIYMNR